MWIAAWSAGLDDALIIQIMPRTEHVMIEGKRGVPETAPCTVGNAAVAREIDVAEQSRDTEAFEETQECQTVGVLVAVALHPDRGRVM